jgi:hypothetical protein
MINEQEKPRYSFSQIWCGLNILFREHLGADGPFDRNSRIDEYLKSWGLWEELEIPGIIMSFFGFSCSSKEWKAFFCQGKQVLNPQEWEETIAPKLTFGALADFIGKHCEGVSLKPLNLFGKSCLTAGIFRDLEDITRKVYPWLGRFGPSSPIRKHLAGLRLLNWWERLRWVTEEKLPPLDQSRVQGLQWLAFLVFLEVVFALVLAGFFKDWINLPRELPVFFSLIYLEHKLFQLINPLPEGIDTFGDLARYLANAAV